MITVTMYLSKLCFCKTAPAKALACGGTAGYSSLPPTQVSGFLLCCKGTSFLEEAKGAVRVLGAAEECGSEISLPGMWLASCDLHLPAPCLGIRVSPKATFSYLVVVP